MIRLLDVLLSGLAILASSPFLLLIAILLRLTGEGEIFYRQSRVGKGGRDFEVLKFATMLKDSPNIGAGTVTLKNDPRVLPVGRILRKTKLNELPQLFNVYFGEMSLIGPRPLTRDTFEAFPERLQPVVSSVRPGLSGIGSVIFRDEEDILKGSDDPKDFHRNVITPYKARLEAWFVSHRSTGLYLLLILLTIWVVWFPRSKAVWRLFPTLPEPPQELAFLKASKLG